jgi:alpha-L-rhamnosidase
MKTPTITLFLILMAFANVATFAADLNATSLKCEYRTNPLAIDASKPRLSWIVESSQRGTIQTAYEILVASDPKILNGNRGDLWESGKVAGDQNSQIAYAGKRLTTRTQCVWKVRIWDNHGNVSSFSSPASWRMGLLDNADWKGTWIGLTADTSKDLRPAPFARKEFSLTKGIRKATAYITARGLFIASLNGRRIGNDVLSPEWTDYRKRIQYMTYDVTPLLKQGSNCAGLIIGDGWYRGFVGFGKRPNNYGDQTSALLQLHVEFSDGTEQLIVTDRSWKGSYGPILFSDLLMGEDYDARLQMTGWDKPGFDDGKWQPVTVFSKSAAKLVALPTEPVRITQLFKPRNISEPKKGMYVIDLGQNFAGFIRLKVRGQAGTEITIRHAEVLNPDGTIYTTNLRRAKATEKYTLSGKGIETYEPHFTFHGFRYVELTGYPGKLAADAVMGCAINTDLPVTGSFSCSDKIVNQLVSNILWSQRGNFISIPTDCPQRDERLGWMGDAQIFVRTASLNMDVSSFMTKWMEDVVDAQAPNGAFMDTSPYIDQNGTFGAPGWGDAGVIVPWNIYRSYGDTRIIDEHFDAMERWMNYMAGTNPDFLRENGRNNDYGDWLSIEAETPKDLLATAFWAYDAWLMADMAKATGRTNAQKKYEGVFNSVKSAFQKAYISADGNVHGATQTGYVLALAFNLMPDHLRQAAAQFLVDDIKAKRDHLSTGFIGVKYLNPLLTEMGHVDVAYKLLFNKTFPSWGFPITQGATTIWERWDGWTTEKGFQDPGMNSFNHYSMGSVGEWLYRQVAGIDLGEKPGYKEIVIHPRVTDQLSRVNGSYLSPQGIIKSTWEQNNGKLRLNVTIPANTVATIYVPAKSQDIVRESGKPVKNSAQLTFVRYENGCAVFQAGSGAYKFESSLK